MRSVIAALIFTLMLASDVLAQRRTSYVIPSVPAPRDPPPHFTIAPRGGALPPMGLPLPHLGLRPVPRPGYPDRHHRDRRVYSWPAVVFYVPQPLEVPAPPPEPRVRPSKQAASSRLILDVQPNGAEIFSDGYYIGVPEDFSAARGGGILEAGVHRIDVSAPGFEPVTVDVRLAPGQSVTYRATLKALPTPVATAPTTFYLIPGCYMGNIPPKDARLPASCDQSRAISWRP
jgi:hypothetical protein